MAAKKTEKVTVSAKPKKVEKKNSKFSVVVYNLSGEEVGEMELPKEVFGVEVNKKLLLQALRVYSANTRQGTQSTKTRAEVRGGGRKPWQQKGTGRARQGSTRAPHWRGGGVTFGPKPRDFSLGLSQRMRQEALRSALSSKLEDLLVVSDVKLREPKTGRVATALKKLGVSGKALLVLPEYDENVVRASRNISSLRLTRASDLNALEVISAGKLILAKDSVGKILEKHVNT